MELIKLKPIFKRIAKNTNRPLLSNVLSKDNTLSITDLETCIIIKNTNLSTGLIKLDTLGLTNEVNNHQDLDDYPVFGHSTLDNNITISIKDLELLLESASKDETRLNLNGIAWDQNNLVSTNGHVLTLIKTEFTNNLEDTVIMPRASIKELVQLSKKYKLKECSFSIDGSFFTVDNEHFTLSGRLISRGFPKYQTIIPVKTSHKIELNELPKYSTIKDLFNKRTNAAAFKVDNGLLTLNINNTEFSQVIGQCNNNTEFGFNYKYFEFLSNLGSTIKFNNELSPFLVEKDNYIRVAMPLKL